MPDRIAIDISALGRDNRGMGFFLREFLFHLSKINFSGLEILLLVKEETQEKFSFPVASYLSIDKSWRVWFPFNYPWFEPPGDYFVTIHDLAPFVFPIGEKTLQKKYLKGAEKAVSIVADSKFIAGEIEQYLFVEHSKISVVPLGFNVASSNLEPMQTSTPYILAVGPAEYRKNFQTLIRAFAELRKRGKNVKLVILGELPPWRKKWGPFLMTYKNPLPALVKRLGLEGQVIFPGFVSPALKEQWYRGATLFVVPSLYEGFGFPVLESFSFGVPLACSNAASLPEVAGGGAFYFDPHNINDMFNVIERALSAQQEREENVQRGKEQLQRFSWEICVRDYLKLFASS